MKDNLVANARQEEGYRVQLEVARALTEQELFEAAASHARGALELAQGDGQRANALLHQGLCHLSAGQLDEAEVALAEAALLTDDPGLVAYHRGRTQLEWRDYIEALERFEEALSSGSAEVPKADLFFHMTVCYVKLEEYSEARSYLTRWEDAGGRPATICFYRGLCDLGEGKTEEALAAFRDAVGAGPPVFDRGRVLFYIGFCLKELGRFAEAIGELERTAEVDPDDLAVQNLLGFCYYKTERYEEAVTCFQRAIEIDPRSGIDHANLASNFRDLGRIDEAIAMYRKALALDPLIDFARDNLDKLTSR